MNLSLCWIIIFTLNNGVLSKPFQPDILRKECLAIPVKRPLTNERALRISCNYWPKVQQLVNENTANTLILTAQSFGFFKYLTDSGNHTYTANRIISPSKQEELLRDVTLRYISKMNPKYVLIFQQNHLGSSHREFVKQSLFITTEIQYAKCKGGPTSRLLQKFHVIIVNCELKETVSILNQAAEMVLFAEPYSWLIFSNDAPAVETVLQNNDPTVIADVVLLQTMNFMEVRWKRGQFSNGSNTSSFTVNQTTMHLTRIAKVCREAGILKSSYNVERAEDLEAVEGYKVPHGYAGCHVMVAALESPPYVHLAKDGVNVEGNDYQFMDLVNRALGLESEYEVLSIQKVIDELLRGNFSFAGFKVVEEFDLGLPLLHTIDKNLVMKFGAENSVSSFLLPFSPTVWASVVSITIITVIVWSTVRYFHNYRSDNPSHTRNVALSVWKSACDIMSIMPMQGVSEDVPGLSFKVTLATVSVFTLLNVTCYSAVLMSYLSGTAGVVPFRSLEGFLENDEYNFIADFNDNSSESQSALTMLTGSGTESERKLKRKNIKTVNMEANHSNLLEHIDKRIYIQFAEIVENIAIKYSPNFVIPFGRFFRWERRVIYKKNFPYKNFHFKIARRLYECGLYQRILDDHLYRMKFIENRRHIPVSITPIEFDTVSVLFGALGIGIISAIGVFLAEHLAFWKC